MRQIRCVIVTNQKVVRSHPSTAKQLLLVFELYGDRKRSPEQKVLFLFQVCLVFLSFSTVHTLQILVFIP